MTRFAHLADRFHNKVDTSNKEGCWLWTGACNNKGYGVFNLGPTFGCKTILAHRMAYELAVGELSPQNEILHACDNPLCCNPSHLSPGTHAENMRQMAARKRSAIGKRNAFSKLSDEDVRNIRNDQRSVTALALAYNVAHQTISKARAGLTWKHVA